MANERASVVQEAGSSVLVGGVCVTLSGWAGCLALLVHPSKSRQSIVCIVEPALAIVDTPLTHNRRQLQDGIFKPQVQSTQFHPTPPSIHPSTTPLARSLLPEDHVRQVRHRPGHFAPTLRASIALAGVARFLALSSAPPWPGVETNLITSQHDPAFIF